MKKFKRGKLKSEFERGLQRQIDRRKNKSVTVTYERDRLPFNLVRHVIPDWVLEFEDGYVRFIEAKGRLRKDDITKLLALKRTYPDMDIRIVFMRDNPLYKGYYSDWAKKNGFPYAIEKIPPSWFTREG